MTLQITPVLLLAVPLSLAFAAAPVIGVASAKGSFRIDQAPVAGNGTLFEGATIETSRASSDLRLSSGARIQLGSSSRGRVYKDRMILERGASEIRNAAGFDVEARGLRVLPGDSSSIARLSIGDNQRVVVAALAGSVRVTNAKGTMIAAISHGNSLEFESHQAGASAPARLTGCLVKRDGRFFLTDDTAHITVELIGSELDKYTGNRIEVTGSQIPGATPAARASQVIQVASLKVLSKRCALPAGPIAGGAAKTAGMSLGTKAVIAGVIVAGAGAGTAVAVTSGDDEPTISR